MRIVMRHAARRPLAWLIFDVELYPLLFAMRRVELRFFRGHAVGRAELKGIHAVGARGGSDERSGWWVFEPLVLVAQLKARRKSWISVAGGDRFSSPSSFDEGEECIRAILPNKAPEPTPVAVMPRAILRVIESAFGLIPPR